MKAPECKPKHYAYPSEQKHKWIYRDAWSHRSSPIPKDRHDCERCGAIKWGHGSGVFYELSRYDPTPEHTPEMEEALYKGSILGPPGRILRRT